MHLLSRLSALGLGSAASERWTVPDLIDFDYYVDEDERLLREKPAERKHLQERDRALYRQRIEPALDGLEEHTPQHRARALRRWLEARRENEDPALRPLLPGASFASAQRLVTRVLAVIGFFLGVGVASALLQYDGQHPVNVSWYVFWLVLVQVLLAGTTLGLWYARRTKAMQSTVADVSVVAQLFRPVFIRAARWVQRSRVSHMSQDVRDRAQARKGLVEGHYALYGPAAYLPVLIPAQVFGIAFNVGAILVTIALEWFTDLAFGWGSALAVQPDTIHALARIIAAPWSWLFGEGVGYPTLEQVAGTRISLKDPLFIFSAEHLRSWRWFVVLAVFTYGLVPRLILLGLSGLKQRQSLGTLPFTHQRTQALYARMVTPSLETAVARSGVGPEMPIPAPLKPLTTARAAPRTEQVKPPPVKPPTKPEASPPAAPKGEEAAPPAAKPSTEPAAPPTGKTGVEARKPAVKPAASTKTKRAAAAPGAAPERMPEASPKPAPSIPPAMERPEPTTPEPELKKEPELEQEPKPRVPAPPPTSVPAVEPRPKPTPEPKEAPERKPTREPEPEPKAEPRPPAEPVARPAPKPEPETEREPEPKTEPVPELEPEPERQPEPEPKPESAAPSGQRIAPDACVLLIHVDVADVLEDEDHGRLQQLLRAHTGWTVAASATFGGGTSMARQALGLIADADWQSPPARVALVQDGSQPPITENLRFLREVRAAAGEQAPVLLALIGDPEGDDDDPLPPISDFEYADWQRKIEQLGDPYLRLEMLATADSEE